MLGIALQPSFQPSHAVPAVQESRNHCLDKSSWGLFFLAEQMTRLSKMRSVGREPQGSLCSDQRTGEILHIFDISLPCSCTKCILARYKKPQRSEHQNCRKLKEEKKKQPACWNVWISLGYIMTIKLSKKLKNTHVFKPCLISLRFSLGREKGKIIIIKSITRRLDLALLPVEGLLGPLPDQTSLVPGDDPAGAPATVQYHMLFRGLNLKNETILCACVTLLCPSPRCFPTCKIIAASTRLSEWRFRVLSAKHGFEVVLMAAFIAP